MAICKTPKMVVMNHVPYISTNFSSSWYGQLNILCYLQHFVKLCEWNKVIIVRSEKIVVYFLLANHINHGNLHSIKGPNIYANHNLDRKLTTLWMYWTFHSKVWTSWSTCCGGKWGHLPHGNNQRCDGHHAMAIGAHTDYSMYSN